MAGRRTAVQREPEYPTGRTLVGRSDGEPPANAATEARTRLLQTFRFLKELAVLRNPVQRTLNDYSEVLRLDSWPLHPSIQVSRGDTPDDSQDQGASAKGVSPIIRITRAELTHCPPPPKLLHGWLKPGWQDVDAEVQVLEARNSRDEKTGVTETIEFTERADRPAALNAWKATRAHWAEAERPAVAARQIFERIYALWTRLQREGDRLELVLADGMLCVKDQDVLHPVLLQRITLDFDPSGPEFRFSPGIEKADLQRTILRLVPSIQGRMISAFDKDLETEPIDPLGGTRTEGFFKRLVQGLFKDGEFLDDAPDHTTERPSVWRAPVIFARPRIAGLRATLDHIIADLEEETTAVPEGLVRIVGVESGVPETPRTPDADTSQLSALSDEADILFSKPANVEQREIATRLETAKSVVVQGPPGTGKTHTIANLLGHLLSSGKSVLVTAHTAKALRVLREKMAEDLQPLCLSVLDGDSHSQSQLSHAAQEIAHRLSTFQPDRLQRDARALRARRAKLLNRARALKRQLRDARFGEIDEIVFSGDSLRPIEAAKRVREWAATAAWIPGPLEPGVLCPLSDQEVRDLYASQGVLTPHDESKLAVDQPELDKLVAPADFRLLAAERTNEAARAQAHRPELWAGAETDLTAAKLEGLHERLTAAAETLADDERWLREALYAGWTGGDLGATWRDLLDAMSSLTDRASAAKRLTVVHGPELPAQYPVEELVEVLSGIVDFQEGGGRLGFATKITKRSWHRVIAACKVVDDRQPRTHEELCALRAAAELQLERARFVGRWRRLVEVVDGPSIQSLQTTPERVAKGYAGEIRRRLEWTNKVWDPLVNELREAGFRWTQWLESYPPVPGDHGELDRVRSAVSDGLTTIIEGRAAMLRQLELTSNLQAQRTYLAGFPQSDAASALLRSQDGWEVDSYEEAHRESARLRGLRDLYTTRVASLERLSATAPEWARAIAARRPPHHDATPPADHKQAWHYRQLHQELERRAAVSLDELQLEIDQISAEVQQLSARIIDCEAWAAQCERTGLQEKQALLGFVQTMRKVGKRSKRGPELLRRARELLAAARRAVPVWIMPLSRVYESFNPREAKFDVIIVDEASQSDVTALAALYLGRTHIVVGDKEQVTPDAIGQSTDEVQRLIETELQGIPNNHLYDGQTSIYDLAEASFGGTVALREHFRCVPEIIQFSNHLSYNNAIRALREPYSAIVAPALVPQRVKGYREGVKTNEVEAEEIVSLIAACLDDPEYRENELEKPTSLGVISLLGDEQAYLIESKLRQRLPLDVFTKHRLLCGNAAQFQGDERDVIFLSVVDGPPEDGQLPLRDAGYRDLYKKRYNVAVSRARNQVWVIHSLDPAAHLKNGDLRRRLIEHARDPSALLRTIEEQGAKTESPFEKSVLERLLSAGFRVRAQWPVGSYRIDLVVEGEKRRLAVECDGERFHTVESLQEDLERQAVLERLGWIFVRIRGSLFFRDPDRAMESVFEKCRDLDIEPLGTRPAESEPLLAVEHLRRRAEALRRKWAEETEAAESGDLFR